MAEPSGWYYLNGQLEIGAGGIVKRGYADFHVRYGSITSSEDYLTVTSTASTYFLTLYSPIVDNGWRKVGLRVLGRGSNGLTVSELWLHNGSGNTYTGDTIVERGGSLMLCNLNAQPSIQSRRLFVNNGKVFLYKSNQLRKDASVYLSNSGEFNLGIDSANQTLSSLSVSGRGVLGFGISSNIYDGQAVVGYRNLYLDDLIIDSESELLIRNWDPNKHRLFVRRSSRHLDESLSRIKYEKRGNWHASKRWSDDGYWEIYGQAPEPTVYGAVFGTLGLGVVGWRRGGNRWRRRLSGLPCAE